MVKRFKWMLLDSDGHFLDPKSEEGKDGNWINVNSGGPWDDKRLAEDALRRHYANVEWWSDYILVKVYSKC